MSRVCILSNMGHIQVTAYPRRIHSPGGLTASAFARRPEIAPHAKSGAKGRKHEYRRWLPLAVNVLVRISVMRHRTALVMRSFLLDLVLRHPTSCPYENHTFSG